MISNLINKLKLLNIKIDVVDSKLDIKAPKGAIDALLLEDIKLHKEKLIDYINTYKAKKVSHFNIKAIPLKSSYPLSSAQKRLWLVSQIEDYSIAYNIPSYKILDGNYKIENFKKAIDATIERHEILRTVFRENEEGEVNQSVLLSKELGFTIDYVDLTKSEDQNAGISNYFHQDSVKRFDLEKGPLLRAALLQLSENKHVFYYNMHHIISDGWSMDVLVKDVLAYYKSYTEESAVELPDLKIQYKDYSAWQLEQMEQESHQAHKAYWCDTFSGELPTINLPAKNKRPLIKGNKGKRLGTYISKENSQKLKKFCQEKGGSLFMGLLSNLNAVFYKYTGQNDLIIGTPIAGRDHLDLENQIGFYVNTLALRNHVNPNESFNELLENIKKNTLKAYEHQEYPFDQLIEDLNLKRDISRSALFDVMMVLQNGNQEPGKVILPEETVNTVTDFGETISKFDLEINFREAGDCISFQMIYNTEVYDKEMIEHFLKHYKQLLESSLEHPNQKLSELEYLTEPEKRQLLFDFNDTKVVHTQNKTLVDLFEEQVAETPDDTAVIFEDRRLTYKELNEKANQLAAYLRAHYTIDPDDLIAVKLERNEFLLVSLLGVLKSGAAYVPVDLNYPQHRIDYIEKDSNSKVVIDQDLLEKFYEVQDNYSPLNADQRSTSDHLAYIIYTSGTTGNPKGVMIEHHNAVELINWSKKEYHADAFDIVYGVTSHCFDLSVYEFFYTLSIGKKIRILKNALEINHYLDQDSNILLNTVPSVVRKLIEDKAPLDAIKVINMAGEVLPTDIIAKLPLDKIEVRNLYGPSEDTTYSTSYLITGKRSRNISIGKPISNTQVLILDQNNQLVPVGVTGRIFVSGAGVSRGYLNRADLTEEKFLTNPFIEGERMYDTGDLGYWLSDGNIEFIGRKDHQVKIRGYRIELGEIEIQLLSKENIQEVTVQIFETEEDKQIVAYFVSEKEERISDLRDFLLSTLPNYMIPAVFIQLSSIPLTPNGKIDRAALPNQKDFNQASEAEYIAPTNSLEEELTIIWKGLLNRELIGIKDDFFELGGHSIKLGKLINTYQKKFDVKLSFSQLFENTSLISHAGLISKAGKLKYKEIEKAVISESYPLSDAQRRLWVLSQFEENSVAYNMPSYHALDGGYNIDHLKKAIDAAIDRHEVLRTVFRENESGEIQQWVLNREAIDFNIDYCDFSNSHEKQLSIKEYIQKDSQVLFDLENGPLLRAALLQVSENDFVFYYNMHHIISDGWSMDILTKDVLKYYQSFVNSTEPNLPELRIQYKDYSVWQLNQLKETTYQAHQLFWLDKLSGELPVIDLPSTKKRPVVKTNNGERLGTYLSKEISYDLKAFCQQKGGSLFMGLVASLNALLYRYTSQEDFIIGSPVAGRDHIDLENQIGFYLNMIPLRNKVDPEHNFNKLFDAVKSHVLEAYEHQQYPFDRLVEDLDLQRDMGRSAIFDLVLMLQNVGEKAIESNIPEELTNRITSLGKSVSKFDIEINFEEIGDLISFQINYNTDVYDHDMITGFIKHYLDILTVVLQSPDEPLYKIDYLSSVEKAQLLEDFNNNRRDFEKGLTIVDLFANQAKANPDHIALVYINKEFTYRELDEASDALLCYLLSEYDVQIEDFIGIKLERNEWLVISLLSVLKMGAAYVPIDPAYPVERIKYIEKDAHCKMIIDKDLLEAFALGKSNKKNESLKIAVKPENLAYVIYTSGSTGMPKGVMIEHKNAVSFLNNVDFELGFKGHSIVAGTTNVVFDISVLEIFGTLCSGRKLILFSSEELMSPELFMDNLHRNKIEVLQVTPSRFSQLSEAFTAKPSPYLKQLLMGGEPFPKTVYDTINTYSGLNIINVYGPTETTIWSTSLAVNSSKYLSIGKPLANEKVLILSDKLQIQPIGVVGELYIAGDGLARGYLNKEKLTNEKFIENPYEKGGKIYATGDLARWRPDGNIEYIERKDDQVKIRGHRIELGEIENVLLQQREIEQAVVLVKEKDEEKFIISYLVGKDLNIDAIRIKLSEFLPGYMLPNYFVILNKMPLNASGKIDKKALLEIDKMEISSKNYVAPCSKEEKIVISICEKLLKKENISVKDNFYNIGGDSLKIIQLMNQLNREGYAVKVDQIFKASDFEALAKVITIKENKTELVDLNKDISFKSESEIVNENINWKIGDKIHVSENQKYIMKFKNSEGFIGPVKISKSDTGYIELQLREFLSNFPDLNIEFIQEDQFIYQRRMSYKDLKIAISTYDVDLSGTANISQLISNEVPVKPYDIFNGELIRLFIFNDIKGGEESYIYIAISHVIADMYTCNILQQELMNFLRNNKVLKNQYPSSGFDFALWQKKYLQSEKGMEERSFWINDLKKPALELLSDQKSAQLKRYDYVSDSNKVTHTTQTLFVTGQKFERIKQLSQDLNIPLSGLFMGFHQYLMHDCFKEQFHFQLITVSGRESTVDEFDTSRVLGAFNNFIPLRLISNINDSLYDLFQNVYLNYLNARMHQVIPYETIREDFFVETQIDIDLCRLGGVNFHEIPGTIDENKSNILILGTQLLSNQHPLDIICRVRKNGIEIILIYQQNTEIKLPLDTLLDNVISKTSPMK